MAVVLRAVADVLQIVRGSWTDDIVCQHHCAFLYETTLLEREEDRVGGMGEREGERERIITFVLCFD